MPSVLHEFSNVCSSKPRRLNMKYWTKAEFGQTSTAVPGYMMLPDMTLFVYQECQSGITRPVL
jgi:hypothetical protein